MCLQCGHCEAFCPTEALALNLRPEERMPLPEGAGEISPETMAFYLKKRRSIRPLPKQRREFPPRQYYALHPTECVDRSDA